MLVYPSSENVPTKSTGSNALTVQSKKTTHANLKNTTFNQNDEGFWSSPFDHDVLSDGEWPYQDETWDGELKRLSKQLSSKIRNQLNDTKQKLHIDFKCREDFITNLSEELVATASKEPCGIRGCSVYLRLLHEDVAAALLAPSQESNHKTNNIEGVSWPDSPNNFNTLPRRQSSESIRSLEYENLPDMDRKLTMKFSPDTCSTDSGFSDGFAPKRRLKQSVSTNSASFLPVLSSASCLDVPCADLGQVELDSNTVPNFELYVYLVPEISWSWRIKKFFAKSMSFDSRGQKTSTRKKCVTLSSDFTLVKKKLFRSRCNSKEVIRCYSK